MGHIFDSRNTAAGSSSADLGIWEYSIGRAVGIHDIDANRRLRDSGRLAHDARLTRLHQEESTLAVSIHVEQNNKA